MIRELRKADVNRVAKIWLDTNITAHYFISVQYWKSNFELVKELLLQTTVYVYEDNQGIRGFIGLNNEYVEGVFVSKSNAINPYLFLYAFVQDQQSINVHRWYPVQLAPSSIPLCNHLK